MLISWIMTIFLFILGLVFLIVGAEGLVRGASRLASTLGISPLVIGLTVVAFGTSSPELAVSVKSALSGQTDIAVGNVVGSNIFNVLFILGLSALIVPLAVQRQLIRVDVPFLIALSVAVLLFSLDGNIGRIDGVVLVSILVLYTGFLIRQSRREGKGVQASSELGSELTPAAQQRSKPNWIFNGLLVAGGLVLLVLGSRWLVDSAVIFARHLGISDLIVGLTIVAAGTSLPEVVTSILAALRGERDIAVGNVIGSNIFNILGVLGLSSLLAPTGLIVSPSAIAFDIPVMIAVAFACLPIFFTGGVINRWEGFVFLGYYIAYTLYLIFSASHHDALGGFTDIMLYFAFPLTALTLVLVLIRELRTRKSKLNA